MMRVPEHPTQIRRMLNARLTRLGGSEPILAASLAEVQRRCGQPSCRCGKGGPLHTSHQLTFKNQGKTKTVYVPIDLVDEVRSWIDNHKRLKTLLSEIHQLTVALVKTHASHTSRKAGRV
jgi:hypothetical protein